MSDLSSLIADQWQPIETAPRDGTVFFGIGPADRYPQAMKWETYSPEEAEEIGEHGYWTYAEDLIADVAGQAEPTHWMPLPSPLRANEGKDNG